MQAFASATITFNTREHLEMVRSVLLCFRSTPSSWRHFFYRWKNSWMINRWLSVLYRPLPGRFWILSWPMSNGWTEMEPALLIGWEEKVSDVDADFLKNPFFGYHSFLWHSSHYFGGKYNQEQICFLLSIFRPVEKKRNDRFQMSRNLITLLPDTT